jgi:hypothetical protein
MIDHIYNERYKKYLYYCWWALTVPGHSWVKRSAVITKRKKFPQVVAQHG